MRARRVVIGLIAGLIIGSAIGSQAGPVALRVVSIIEPIGQLWVGAIRMTVVPLVISLLFVGVAGHDSNERLGRIGAVTMVTFVALLVFAAIVALLLAPPLMADMKLSPDAVASLRATAGAEAAKTTAQAAQLPGFAAWVTSLVPANVVKAAADGAMLPLIVFTLLFGLATRQIEASLRGVAAALLRRRCGRDDNHRRLGHLGGAGRNLLAGRCRGEPSRHRARRSDGVLHHRDLGGAGAVRAAHVSHRRDGRAGCRSAGSPARRFPRRPWR